MRSIVDHPDFQRNRLALEQRWGLGKVYVTLNGEKVTAGETVEVENDHGAIATVSIDHFGFGFNSYPWWGLKQYPDVRIDGQEYEAVRKLRWYEWSWAMIPLLLILVAGAIGAIIGVIAVVANCQILRSDWSTARRYGAAGACTIFAGLISVGAVLLISSLIGGA